MGSHGSSSLLGIHDEMFQHFVSDIHKVMTAFIVKLTFKSIIMEISLQLHGYAFVCSIRTLG
jgi:hypothetical protein